MDFPTSEVAKGFNPYVDNGGTAMGKIKQQLQEWVSQY